MKRKIRMACAAITAAVGITLAWAAPASAFSSEAQQEEAEPDKKAGPLEEQEPDQTEPSPFAMPGNGKLVDDTEDDGSDKQFLSVQTKNGNMFYIVVDRSGNAENVYMMSLIDENDLKEFVEADSVEELPEPEPAVDFNTSTDTESEDGQEDKSEKPESSAGMGGAVPILIILGAGAAGAYYYFKVRRPQEKADGMDGEPVEFYDGYEESREDGTENED